MNQEEKTLRENIRHLIRHVKQKKLNEENDLRGIIRKMMDFELAEGQTPDVDPAPNKSTGINVLEELLKKIIPIVETDYKSLTTNSSQRDSYRAHVLNAVDNSLTPAKINNQAGEDSVGDLEEIEIQVGDKPDDKFIALTQKKPLKNQKTKIQWMALVPILKEMKRAGIWPTNHTKKLNHRF